MGNTHVNKGGARVPSGSQKVWLAKRHVFISHDGTRIDLYGGDKGEQEPKHLTKRELAKVTKTLLHNKVASINVANCKKLTSTLIKAMAEGCPKLKKLNVNGIENLSDESIMAIAKGCPDLKGFHISYCNNLTDESMKTIAQGCPELKEFDVNGIENLTDESMKAIANGCPKLKKLNVHNIKNLTDSSMKAIAQGCPELKKLNVSGCRLGDSLLPAICEGCSRLEVLNAYSCGLVSVPEEIGESLPHLWWLDIRSNSVSALPASICKLKDLRRLDVYKNPLQSPPYEIANQGIDAIKRYFEEVSKGSSLSKLLKVVLVGDGEAGKTTLRNALAGRPNPRQEDRTIHLDIEKITLNDDLDINVYDCGGQEEYLATQLPYITGLALYMVVVDAQYASDEHKNLLEDKLHRFLVILQNRVPGAVILPIVTKVDTVEDAERRCHWLETTIENLLRNTLEALCGDAPESSADRAQPPTVLPASVTHDHDIGNGDTYSFTPLRVQSPALAISVADTDDEKAVHDSVKAVRERIIALTKLDPGLLRMVGQQIPSSYMAVLKLFGAIAEYGDNDRALDALRDDTAHALGETSELSPNGTYQPKDELEDIWNTYRDQSDGNVKNKVFDDATGLWEAQGIIFVDAGLVVLQPHFITMIVKPLVDHRYNNVDECKLIKTDVRKFLKSTSSRENKYYTQLIDALSIFIISGEFESSDESLFLSFLWRDTGLNKSHYGQVLQMLARSGVILKVERDAGERRTVAVVPFRLPQYPNEPKVDTFWPKSLPLKERELKLRFKPITGFPTGLAERFVTDVHGLGTSLYSWRHGVVVKDCAGYSALAERIEDELHFTVRFEKQSSKDADAAWKALCDAKQILAAQRENRFPGLYYEECFVCEQCCRERRRTASTANFDTKKRKIIFRGCGHCFDLDSKGKGDPAIAFNFNANVSNPQIAGIVEGNANYHFKSPEVS